MAGATPAQVKAATAKWLTRPVYALTVEPGAREAYTEAAAGRAQAVDRRAGQGHARRDAGRSPTSPTSISRRRCTPSLKNGIELIYAQRAAVPITQAVISFDAGVAADPAAKLGTQQLTLGMMDEGTTSLDSIGIAEAKERLGASIGSGASADRTSLTLSAPSPNLVPALDLFADIVRNPAFAPAEVDRVQNQQLAQIQAELTSPGGLAAARDAAARLWCGLALCASRSAAAIPKRWRR